MKLFNFSIIFIFALLITGCAGESKGIDAYKGQTAEQIYTGGKQYLDKKNFSKAIANFEALDALYPFGKYSEPGLLNIVYAYYQNGDYDVAVAVAGRYIHLYPRSARSDYVYYMKGMANFKKNVTWLSKIYVRDPAQRDLSAFRAAFVDFNTLVRNFPKSKYAPDARIHMIYIRDLLARHELQVAKFYMDYDAYVAAANRASYIVKHFQGAPQVVDALKIMVKAYTELGDTKQANDAYRILKLNYPDVKL
jgi:outer membrane protein assembly factor BamD